MKNFNREKTKKTLKIVGLVVVAAGFGCFIAGVINFFVCMANGGAPTLFFLSFIGVLMLGSGGMLIGVASARTTIDGAGNADVKKPAKRCPYCGATADADATKCPDCGARLD